MAIKKSTYAGATPAACEPAEEVWDEGAGTYVKKPGPLLGFIEVEKIVRDGIELRGSSDGGSVGQLVDRYFIELAKSGEEVREFKLVFTEPHQFEQVLKATIREANTADIETIRRGRWGQLLD